MSSKKRKSGQYADKAVEAYRQADRRFDPLGSYTGRNGRETPCQDADDL